MLLCLIGVGPLGFNHGAAIETLLAFALVTGVFLAYRRSERAAQFMAAGILVIELLPFFLRQNPHGDISFLEDPPEAVRRVEEPWRGTGMLNATSRHPSMAEKGIAANTLALYGIHNPAGWDAILPRPYVAWAKSSGAKMDDTGRILSFEDLSNPGLDGAAVKYIFAPTPIEGQGHLEEIGRWGKLGLYENTRALPRARLASARGDVTMETNEPDLIWLHVNADQATILILADTIHPGWEARVNGTPATIQPADVAFRAIEVPGGPSDVEFRFRPSSASLGIVLSLATLISAVGVLFRRRRE